MTEKNTGGQAFPFDAEWLNGQEVWPESAGMTLRDWFAGQALAGYFAAPNTPHQNATDCAAYLYEMADAMLEARLLNGEPKVENNLARLAASQTRLPQSSIRRSLMMWRDFTMTEKVERPARKFAVHSPTGVHIGLWSDGKIAADVAAESPGNTIEELVLADDCEALAAALEAERAKTAGGSFYQEKDIDALQADREILHKAGIVEIAARNPNVMEYIKHREARAERAEAERDAAFEVLQHWRKVTYDQITRAEAAEANAHPKVQALVEALEELLMAFDEHIALPDANCSCHISPPCGDCENYSFAREAHTNARAALSDLKKVSEYGTDGKI